MTDQQFSGFVDFLLISLSALLTFAFLCRIVRGALMRARPVEKGRVAPVLTVAPPGLFARLADLGFTVCAERDYSVLRPAKVLGYAVCFAIESAERCRACKQHGRHAFGETAAVPGRAWNRIDWLGHVCVRCGHMERYVGKADGGGFFGLVLENGDCLLDVLAMFDAEGERPLIQKMERVLAEREAVHLAKAQAAASLRKDLAALGVGATATPFRTTGTTIFLA